MAASHNEDVTPSQETLDWLLEGDPAIRWQVMRDLLDKPKAEWEKEQAKVQQEGWGKQYLDLQKPDGSWERGRWTETIWTMVTLVELGMPSNTPNMEKGYAIIVNRLMPKGKDVDEKTMFKRMDICHWGFWLKIGAHFLPNDPRIPQLTEIALKYQMDDGGWNCRLRTKPQTHHSSFHTTYNILEGLRIVAENKAYDTSTIETAEERAFEFMAEHQMYRSDKTGQVIQERFLDLSSPHYWHYTVLRGLDSMRHSEIIKDDRLNDPIDYILSRAKPPGRWITERRISGKPHFDMEKFGSESRWNTLKALRVLKARGC